MCGLGHPRRDGRQLHGPNLCVVCGSMVCVVGKYIKVRVAGDARIKCKFTYILHMVHVLYPCIEKK